ncbi:hypothetical protein DINM_000972 [Dirofilaria immitis]|nr:hypothetical protein [Dirofilaria immitis]
MSNGKQLNRFTSMLCPMEIDSFNNDSLNNKEEISENNSEGPIANRTRSSKRTTIYAKNINKIKSNIFAKAQALSVVTIIQLPTIANGAPEYLSTSHKDGTAKEIVNQNVTLHKVETIILSNFRRQKYLSNLLCQKMHFRKQINEITLIQSSPNKWTTNNKVQYSYGWWGAKCQSTTNFVPTEGEIS